MPFRMRLHYMPYEQVYTPARFSPFLGELRHCLSTYFRKGLFPGLLYRDLVLNHAPKAKMIFFHAGREVLLLLHSPDALQEI